MTDRLPPELLKLSAHPTIEEIHSLELESIQVSRIGTHVTGAGIVAVEAQYPNWLLTEDLPFTFRVTLNHNLEIKEADIRVDTSSWGEGIFR